MIYYVELIFLVLVVYSQLGITQIIFHSHEETCLIKQKMYNSKVILQLNVISGSQREIL